MKNEMRREKLIEIIEGTVGCYSAPWNEWPTKEIEKLFFYIAGREKWDDERIEKALA